MTDFRIFCFALATVCVYALEEPVLAVTTHTEAIEYIRENGVNYKVRVQGGWYEYANDENCGNPAHRTLKGGRYFAHGHTLYSFPVYGYEVKTGTFMNVTEEKIEAYWDNQYGSNYVPTGGVDPTRNCWSHAFEYYGNVWIQNPTYIYDDDYEEVTAANPIIPGVPVPLRVVIEKPGHAIPIYGVTMGRPGYPNGFVEMTWEKNRSSGGYQRYYSPTGANPFASAKIHQKKQ